MTVKAEQSAVHPGLQDVALIDGPAFAAALGISMSSFHERVRLKLAPAPVIRQSRFTRWRLTDVRAYLQRLTEEAALNPQPGIELIERTRRASHEGATKRAAKRAEKAAAKRASAAADPASGA